MSNQKPVTKRIVRINENALVDMIDGIVSEAVAAKKQEWLNEQATKETEKATLLENRIAALEAKLATKK